MGKKIVFGIGSSDFEDIRRKNKYYIDKSMFIKDVLTDGSTTFLFTRPRRFGKTLNLTMLKSFFDIRENSFALFEGLEIMKEEEIVREHLNQHPIFYLSLKDISAPDFESALIQFKMSLNPLFQSYEYLLDELEGTDKGIFENMLSIGSEPIAKMDIAISILVNAIFKHYKKKVIVTY